MMINEWLIMNHLDGWRNVRGGATIVVLCDLELKIEREREASID